ncbi:MAG: ABC transporter ATP-binding protein [Gammaproteobacteria bacterium]|nr:ABC transporter ATP-binding protein [Gammaproteobacteria bacterium]
MIELKNLTKIYHSDEDGSIALKEISIKFPEVGFVVLTGQSGSGKTTLLNVLSGFQSYEEGSMFIDGVDALAYRDEDWKKYQKNSIGFVFQDYGLIESYSVISNIIVSLEVLGLTRKEAKERALKYLKMVHLDELANQKVIALSSGQKQRLSIARAIAKEPKIVLCDEPTANLDPENSVEIMKLLSDISKERLVITSTHNYEDAKDYADYFVRLYKGNLVSFEAIKTNDNVNTKNPVDKKTKINDLYVSYLKEKKGRTIATSLFVSMIFMIVFTLLSIFLFNTDDSRTKVLNKNTFNNINQEELLIMKRDFSAFSYDELEKLTSNKHIVDYDYYSFASDMNYYYREGVDFEYELVVKKAHGIDAEERIEKVFKEKDDSLFAKSYKNKIEEKDLSSGTLPSAYNEVVANNSYKVGDEIKVFFEDKAMQGYNQFSYTFKVVGVLKKNDNNLYYSEAFIRQLDTMQFYSDGNSSNFRFYYRDSNNSLRYAGAKIIPIYNENLADNEIQLSSLFYETYPTFPRSYETIIYENYNNNTSLEVIVDSSKGVSEDLTQRFMYVGKGIYDLFTLNYESNCARIYVDEYPYVDDVIKALSKNDYDVLSPYRASSIEYDQDLVRQRAISLIASLGLLIFVLAIYYFFYFLFLNMKGKEERVLFLQGADVNSIFKLNLIDSALSLVAGILVGILLYNVGLRLVFGYIMSASKYIRFYHYIIVIIIMFVIGFLSNYWYFNRLKKNINKGGL